MASYNFFSVYINGEKKKEIVSCTGNRVNI